MKLYKLDPSYGKPYPKYDCFETTVVIAESREDALELVLKDFDTDSNEDRYHREAYMNGTIEEINLEDCEAKILSQECCDSIYLYVPKECDK